MKYALVLCALGVALPFSSQQFSVEDGTQFRQCFPNNRQRESDYNALSSEMIQSRLKFTIDFTKEVLKRSKTGTILFFSPHSVYNAMLLALFISNNQTEKEIKDALRIPSHLDKEDAIRSFQMNKLWETTRSQQTSANYELNEANRFFHEKTLPVRPCMESVFGDELEPVDFKNDKEGAKQFIDQWVSNQTRGQINDLLANADLEDDTKLILVNAMYFKGLWKSKFLPESTRKEVFYVSPRKNSLIPMMQQKSNFKYLISEKLEAHVIELPYKGDHISMFIILPSFYHPLGIKHLLEKLTPEIVTELVEPGFMIERPVELMIPKFTIEKTLEEVVPILESMGVKDLFTNSSDFSTLTGSNDIMFNEIVHKAKVSVDEDGTTAAASTAMFTFRSSRPLDPIKFVCNHPFIFFIYDHLSKSVLFIGMYGNPNVE